MDSAKAAITVNRRNVIFLRYCRKSIRCVFVVFESILFFDLVVAQERRNKFVRMGTYESED